MRFRRREWRKVCRPKSVINIGGSHEHSVLDFLHPLLHKLPLRLGIKIRRLTFCMVKEAFRYRLRHSNFVADSSKGSPQVVSRKAIQLCFIPEPGEKILSVAVVATVTTFGFCGKNKSASHVIKAVR